MSDKQSPSVLETAKLARDAASILRNSPPAQKRKFLEVLAEGLLARTDSILAANAADCEAAQQAKLSTSFLERLSLSPSRISALANSVRIVAASADPVGSVLSEQTRADGLKIEKIAVPLGVIALIYESRPGVTIDSAALCIQAGNAVILRSGKDARRSTEALVQIIQDSLSTAGLPQHAAQMVADQSYDAVRELVKLEGLIDLVIPRGGESLIRDVVENARVPVLKHYRGVCHLYVDSDADPDKAERILLNAKCQRPGVCNAVETLLVHAQAASSLLPRLGKSLVDAGVTIRGCSRTLAAIPQAVPATEDDWAAEYLDLIISVRVVESIEEAVHHIERYGSRHSDAIVTENEKSSRFFVENVDSAAVFVNASTRLCDGGEFGLGTEIGISTDKLHARGPMGVRELTTYQWRVRGDGHVR